MRRAFKLLVMAAFIASTVGLLPTQIAVAENPTSWFEHFEHEYDRFAQMLWEFSETLEYALAITGQAIHDSATPEDQRITADFVSRLLRCNDETGCANVSSSNEAANEEGIHEILERFQFEEEMENTAGQTGYLEGLRQAQNRLSAQLRLTDMAARRVYDDVLSDEGRRDELLVVQALLFTVYEYVDALSRERGFQVRVEPGESIQAAIDLARSGATILVSPGIYRETLEITKSLTIDSSYRQEAAGPYAADATVRDEFEAKLEPIAGQTGILIRSDTPIQVVLRNLTIANASTGVEVSGSSQAFLSALQITGCETAVEVSGASCELSNCRLDATETGLRCSLFGDDHVSAAWCTFAGTGTGIMAVGAGSLEVIRGTFDGPTTGILLGGMVSMNLRLSAFDDCWEGVAIASSASSVIAENEFRGTKAHAIRVSQAPDGSPAGALALTGNTFSRTGTWDLTLCGFDGSEDASGSVTLSGSGNHSTSILAKLCPEDANWPAGLFGSTDE